MKCSLFLFLMLFSVNSMAGSKNIYCSRSYFNYSSKTTVLWQSSAPCCNGNPTWNDCRNQGGNPVQEISSRCEFSSARIQGTIWKCEKNPAHHIVQPKPAQKNTENFVDGGEGVHTQFIKQIPILNRTSTSVQPCKDDITQEILDELPAQ